MKKVGNWVRVFGRHHTRDHYSAILDPNTHGWLHGAAAIAHTCDGRRHRANPDGRTRIRRGANRKPAGQPGPRKICGLRNTGATRMTWRRVVRSALKAYTNDDLHYDAWLQVGMMVHQAFGGDDEGYAIWCDWSATSVKHDEDTCAAKWESFGTDGGLTIGTLFHLAKEQGWERPTRQAVPTPKAQSVMEEYNTRKQTDYTVSEDTNVTTNNQDVHDTLGEADTNEEEIKRNREAHARAKQHSQLQNWTNGADLDIIAKVYCGWTNTNGDGAVVAANSNLHGLYTAVRAKPNSPDVVNQWCETTVPSHLREMVETLDRTTTIAPGIRRGHRICRPASQRTILQTQRSIMPQDRRPHSTRTGRQILLPGCRPNPLHNRRQNVIY